MGSSTLQPVASSALFFTDVPQNLAHTRGLCVPAKPFMRFPTPARFDFFRIFLGNSGLTRSKTSDEK